MNEEQFIRRKGDHIRHSLSKESEAVESAALANWSLIHDSLPELNLEEVSLEASFLGRLQGTPFFIAGMTAGHPDAELINERLSEAAAERGWAFGVGSQRRELRRGFRDDALSRIRKRHPNLALISNLGVAQLIEIHERREWNALRDLVERAGAAALAVHLNPLQEAIQEEGTPQFRGALSAIEACIQELPLPIVLKETGSGMSESFLRRISVLCPDAAAAGSRPPGLHAVDVSGLGGTHWGRIEGMRASSGSLAAGYGRTFGNWGVPTPESIQNARRVFAGKATRIWASGGLRTGLDAAKCLALGAHAAGFARPALEAALEGDQALRLWMQKVEGELRIALFCTNSGTLAELSLGKIQNIRKETETP